MNLEINVGQHYAGGSTEEAQSAIGVEVAIKLIKFVNQGSTIDAVNFPEVNLPMDPNSHRILNIHKNVPGVLRVSFGSECCWIDFLG